MMMIAITIISIGSVIVRNKILGIEKFRTMAIWITIALIVIQISIPWPFLPLASRPYFRTF